MPLEALYSNQLSSRLPLCQVGSQAQTHNSMMRYFWALFNRVQSGKRIDRIGMWLAMEGSRGGFEPAARSWVSDNPVGLSAEPARETIRR